MCEMGCKASTYVMWGRVYGISLEHYLRNTIWYWLVRNVDRSLNIMAILNQIELKVQARYAEFWRLFFGNHCLQGSTGALVLSLFRVNRKRSCFQIPSYALHSITGLFRSWLMPVELYWSNTGIGTVLLWKAWCNIVSIIRTIINASILESWSVSLST